MNPADFIRDYIETHEGGLSTDPDDTGNWHHGVRASCWIEPGRGVQ